MYLKSFRILGESFPSRSCYPFNVPALARTGEVALRSRVAFFAGENGCGKSTLLEAITRRCGIHLLGETKQHRLHDNPEETRLAQHLFVACDLAGSVGFYFRAESFFDFAAALDDAALNDPGLLAYYGGRSLHTLSHGESFLFFFANRCLRDGLYLLDEPEAALSPSNQVAFLRLLRQLEKGGRRQFVIATHSPILLAHPGAQILSFDGTGIHETRYEETFHYQLYRRFLDGAARRTVL